MPDFRFNFVGVNTGDFERAFEFYTNRLGIEPAMTAPPESSAADDEWTMLVAGWDESSSPDGYGLRCELFGRNIESPSRPFSNAQQRIQVSIQVADIPSAVETLRARGISFTGEIEADERGQTIEFIAPDGVRWSLAEPTDSPAGESIQAPHLGWVDLRVADPATQTDFYADVMGLNLAERTESRVHLTQQRGDPLVFLEPIEEGTPTDMTVDHPIDHQPVWLSFETDDIVRAASWLRNHGVLQPRGVETHEWGGSDLVGRDPEGNQFQVVEYHHE